MRKEYFIIILGILLISNVIALEEYSLNSQTNMQFNCNIDGNVPTASATYNITLYDPDGDVILDDVEATAQGNGKFNYTFTFTQIGLYKIHQLCVDGAVNGTQSEDIKISTFGETQNNGVTQLTIYLVLLVIITIFIYIKVDKFLGSLLLIIIGLGMLFTSSNNGWMGWVVTIAGVSMIVENLLSGGRKRRR